MLEAPALVAVSQQDRHLAVVGTIAEHVIALDRFAAPFLTLAVQQNAERLADRPHPALTGLEQIRDRDFANQLAVPQE